MDTSWQQLFPGLLSPDSLQAQADDHTNPDDYFGYSSPVYSDLWNAAEPLAKPSLPMTPKKTGCSESEGSSSLTMDSGRVFLDTPPPAPEPQRSSRRRSIQSRSTSSATRTNHNTTNAAGVKKAKISKPNNSDRRPSSVSDPDNPRLMEYFELEVEQKTNPQEITKSFNQQVMYSASAANAPIPIASMASTNSVPLPRISPAPPSLQFAKAFQQMVQQKAGDPSIPYTSKNLPFTQPKPSSSSTTLEKRGRSASVPSLPSMTIPILTNTVNPKDLMNKSNRSQMTELKRRKLTQESFQQLQVLISPEFCEPKASRAVILSGAVEYITHLQKGIAELKRMIETFRKTSMKRASETIESENNE